MRAATHTEIYRRFEGELTPSWMRFWPLFRARVRVMQKKKLPLLLLYAPPVISGIIFSFIVYGKFAIEDQTESMDLSPGAAIAAAMAGNMLQVHNQIVEFMDVVRIFALLVVAWYGAGMLAEDRKAGAHLLYFARPLTKLDYFLAHFTSASWFGLRAVLAPALLICSVAVFSSPDYSFLKEKWDVIFGTVGYALLVVTMMSSVTLAVSAVVPRKSFALAGIFFLVLLSEAAARTLRGLRNDERFRMISPWANLERLGDWMLGSRSSGIDWNPWISMGIVAGWIAVSLGVVAWRLRRTEVVA